MSTDVFAVVADATRRRILAVVQTGPRPVNDVVTELGVSQPTVSKHLKVLREAGLVTMKAQGQRRLYSLNTAPLAEISSWVEELSAPAADAEAPATPATPEAPESTEPDATATAPEDAPAAPSEPEASAPAAEVAPEAQDDSAPEDSREAPARPHLSPLTESEEYYAADPEPEHVDAEEARPVAPAVAEATGTDGPAPIARSRHDGVTFTPLTPLNIGPSTTGDAATSALRAPAASSASSARAASVPGAAPAGGDPESRRAPQHRRSAESSGERASWEPLDPQVRRAESPSDGEVASGEHKPSGFLANLFGRKRGR
ncbi:ArsR/SmtB family transcription factor [Curtobacterium sp. S6]|uniref:ArsR/SmtB family transcription factor n=1 Tax=Curtobacterium sp. S6 TaxID=1479623 RepID=UPI00068BD85D|nr:metalloregulator ArsR/SmtB family transcription factor [Curtobacterium sp. S6]